MMNLMPDKPIAPGSSRNGTRGTLSRRRFGAGLLRSALGAGLLPFLLRAQQAPAFVLTSRPEVVGGAMIGDVMGQSAVLWSRGDRPSTLLVELSTTENFQNVQRISSGVVLEDTDFSVKMLLPNLPPDQTIFYRLAFQDLTNPRALSELTHGSFRTPPSQKRDIRFAWSGDTAGQGFGIDRSRGGMKTYETIRRLRPDFFVHCGDTIYADVPLVPEVQLDDGTVWKNLVTDAKRQVAESIQDFRGNHFYNLLDENVRRFNADVPTYFLWDDHEVVNNWYPGKLLDDSRYKEKSATLLAARSRRAFFECLPIRPHFFERIYRSASYGPSLELFFLDLRTYRGPNTANRQSIMDESTALLGRMQLDELKQALLASKATWKVLCSDLPIGLLVRDGPNFEAVANGPGPALGRELEIAELLRFLKQHRVRNTIWITADVHHCASILYDPARATFQEFDPFWEFVSGPLHAGTFGPPGVDFTFGPEVKFLGVPRDMRPNRPPSDGHQFFGTVDIDGLTEELVVTHWNVAGDKLWSINLPPVRG